MSFFEITKQTFHTYKKSLTTTERKLTLFEKEYIGFKTSVKNSVILLKQRVSSKKTFLGEKSHIHLRC